MIPTDLPPVAQAVARALEENGFYYDGKTEVECYLPECQIEEFLGWEILIYPVFAVTHKDTGHYWLTNQEPTLASSEEVKQLISRVTSSM